jgi:hypothetical protein
MPSSASLMLRTAAGRKTIRKWGFRQWLLPPHSLAGMPRNGPPSPSDIGGHPHQETAGAEPHTANFFGYIQAKTPVVMLLLLLN